MIGRHNLWAHLRKLLEEPGRELFDGRWRYWLPFPSTPGDNSSHGANGTIERRNLLVALAVGPLLVLYNRPGHLPRAGLSGRAAMFARKVSSEGAKTR